jgi:ketosteroid isomerase-like protein
MSQEDVELVRAAWEAWERRDMEAIFAFYDPEIVWDQTHYGEPSGVYHGHDGIRQFLREWFASFQSYYVHAEEFTDAGEAVVVGCCQGGRGKQSGVEARMPPTGRSTDCEMVARCESRSTTTKVKPSKLLGWRSRRCPRTQRHPV